MLPKSDLAEVSSDLASNAGELFDHLSPLHGLRTPDRALLVLAADIHEHASHSQSERSAHEARTGAALATLSAPDALIVEAVADLSGHVLGYDSAVSWGRVTYSERRRILWLTGILRVADAVRGTRARQRGRVMRDLDRRSPPHRAGRSVRGPGIPFSRAGALGRARGGSGTSHRPHVRPPATGAVVLRADSHVPIRGRCAFKR